MTEGKINSLSRKDFSNKPREMHSIVGEGAAIRLINPNDREDMQRWREMNQVLDQMSEFAGKGSADRSLIDLIRSNQPGKTTQKTDRYMFGVAGVEQVTADEIGELQGCIAIYPVQSQEVDPMIKHGFLPEDTSSVFEISYVKKPTAPSHQMASGVRQVCTQLSQIEAAHYESNETIRPELCITASIKPENEASARVLASSGFEKKGTLQYYEGDDAYDLYVLNWEKLNAKMHQKADVTFLS